MKNLFRKLRSKDEAKRSSLPAVSAATPSNSTTPNKPLPNQQRHSMPQHSQQPQSQTPEQPAAPDPGKPVKKTLQLASTIPPDQLPAFFAQKASSSSEDPRKFVSIAPPSICSVCCNLDPYQAKPDGASHAESWVAYEYNIDYSFIMQFNDLTTGDRFKDGEYVYLQGKKARGADATYTVKAGESMHDISQKTGVKLKELYLKNAMKRNDQAYAGETLYLQTSRTEPPRYMSYSDYLKLKEGLDEVEGVAYQVSVMGQTVKGEGRSFSNVSIQGVTEDYVNLNNLKVEEGRFFTEIEIAGGNPVCVVGTNIATGLYPGESPLGKFVRLGGNRAKIVGILEKKGAGIFGGSQDDGVLIPYMYAARNYNMNRRSVDKMIMVKAQKYENLDYVESEIISKVRANRGLKPGVEDNFSINKQEMLMKQIDTIFKYLEN